MAMSGLIDLRPDQLAIVEDILAEYVPDCEVWAFGSRTTWTAKDYSDLDLAVIGGGPLGWKKLGLLKEAFEESKLPIRVDVLDWHEITESFRETIEDDSVVIQQADNRAIWPRVPLGKLVNNFDSRRVPLSRRERSKRPGPYPYYGATGIMDYIDDYLFEDLHLLVGEDGSVETPTGTPYVQLVDGRFWVNNHAHVLQGLDDDETRFLYYALSATPIRPFVSGSVQAKLTQANLNRVPVPYPKHASDRRAVANVLGTLDDKIELNRRMSETLDEMARALFRSWFVDFDPVRAKAEGRPSGLPSDLDALFPDSFEPSELGDIPAGWQAERLGTIVEQHRHSENPLDSPDTLFDHYSIPAYDAAQTPKEESGENIKSAKFRVLPGTILLSRLNPEIERVWLSDVAPEDRAVCSTEFMVLRPKQPIDRNYTYCLTRSPLFRHQIESLVTGTSKSHQRARPEAVLSLPVVVPPAPIVHAFGEQVSPALTRTLHCRRAMKTLSALRDTLLPKLLSGELRVRDAEQPPAPAAA